MQALLLVKTIHVSVLASWLHLSNLNLILNLCPELNSRRYLALLLQDTLQEQTAFDKHRKPKPYFLKVEKKKGRGRGGV
jgi:hypothetical protein